MYEEDVRAILRNDEGRIRQFRWNAWWCVENLLAMEKADALSFDGIETELNDKIDGVLIKGFVDRWSKENDTIIIGDYKTGKTPKAPWVDDKFDQLLIYGIILSESTGKNIGRLELLYLKDGVRLKKTPSADDVMKVKTKVKHVREQIDIGCSTEIFPAQKSVLCGWCHFKTICPEWSK
jgi:putative RecB family exonuclease